MMKFAASPLRRALNQALAHYEEWERPLRKYRAEGMRRLNRDGGHVQTGRQGACRGHGLKLCDHKAAQFGEKVHLVRPSIASAHARGRKAGQVRAGL